jgi:hypothetical protein
VGLRIQETYLLDIRDWRRDLGQYGNVDVRFGKGSRGRGPNRRLVPAINQAVDLLDWWMVDVRHQFGDDYLVPDAPLLPAERSQDPDTGWCRRVHGQTLRDGLAEAVARWLPAWSGRLTPHVLRHFCASSLYARGLDVKAIQELLGHSWLSTTTRYMKPSGIASGGRATAGRLVPAVSEWRFGPSTNSRLTSDASGPVPSDAGTGRQKVEAVGGRSSSVSKRGKASGGWTPTPGAGIRTVGISDSAIIDAEHVEQAWLVSNERTMARLGQLRE